MYASASEQNQAATGLSRQELALWAGLLCVASGLAGLFFDGQLAAAVGQGGLLDFLFGGGFVTMAWGVALWLLVKAPRRAASRADMAVALGLCLVAAFAETKALPVVVTGLGLWLLPSKDDQTRAAGAVLLAIASQQFWGHLVLGVLAPELVRIDAAMVGEIMTHTVAGSTWHDNIITAPNGHSIVVLEGCSSFANASTALLAWVAFGRLERAKWLGRDAVVGAGVVVSQVGLNVARIYLMAQSYPGYVYWHDGGGKQIYVAAASAAAVAISVIGTHWAGRKR